MTDQPDRGHARLLSGATGAPVPVRGVIAVVGAHNGLTVKTQPDDVAVIARKQIHKWLTRLPPTLPDDRIAMITHAARRSDTWE